MLVGKELTVLLDADEVGSLLVLCAKHRSMLSLQIQDELRKPQEDTAEVMQSIMDETYLIGHIERALKTATVTNSEYEILQYWYLLYSVPEDTSDDDLIFPTDAIRTISLQFNEDVTEERKAEIMEHVYDLLTSEEVGPDVVKTATVTNSEYEILQDWDLLYSVPEDTSDDDLIFPTDAIRTISLQFNEDVTEERKAEIMEHVYDLLTSEEVGPDVVITEI